MAGHISSSELNCCALRDGSNGVLNEVEIGANITDWAHPIYLNEGKFLLSKPAAEGCLGHPFQ